MKTFKNTQLLLIKMLDLFSSYCIIAPFGSQCSLIVVMQWMKMIICFLNFTLLHLMCCDDGGGRNYIYKDICGPHSLCAIIAWRTKSNRLEGLPTRSRGRVAPRLPSDYNWRTNCQSAQLTNKISPPAFLREGTWHKDHWSHWHPWLKFKFRLKSQMVEVWYI